MRAIAVEWDPQTKAWETETQEDLGDGSVCETTRRVAVDISFRASRLFLEPQDRRSRRESAVMSVEIVCDLRLAAPTPSQANALGSTGTDRLWLVHRTTQGSDLLRAILFANRETAHKFYESFRQAAGATGAPMASASEPLLHCQPAHRGRPTSHLELGITIAGVRDWCREAGFPLFGNYEGIAGHPSDAYPSLYRRKEGSWISEPKDAEPPGFGHPDRLTDRSPFFGSCNLVGYDLCEHVKTWLRKHARVRDERGQPLQSVCEVLLERESPHVGRAVAFYSHVQGKWPRRTLECMKVAADTYFRELGLSDSAEVTFWLDYFTLRQCQKDFDLPRVRSVVRSIGATLVELDHTPLNYLSRSFCVFELYCTIHGDAKMLITVDLVRALRMAEELRATPVNCKVAKTRDPKDKRTIDKCIESEIGFAGLDELVTDRMTAGAAALINSAHCTETVDLSLAELKEGDGEAIAQLLSTLTALTELNLSRNALCEHDAIAFADALARHGSLTQCNLCANPLGIDGWRAIFDALRNRPHSKISSWDLSHVSLRTVTTREGIVDEVDPPLVESLAAYVAISACSLTELNLTHTQLDPHGTLAIGQALAVNKSITKIACVAIESWMTTPHTHVPHALPLPLRHLPLLLRRLGYNRLGDEETAALIAPLLHSKTSQLRELHLNHNEIGPMGAFEIGRLCKVSASLARLDVSYNPIGEKAEALLREAVKHRPGHAVDLIAQQQHSPPAPSGPTPRATAEQLARRQAGIGSGHA